MLKVLRNIAYHGRLTKDKGVEFLLDHVEVFEKKGFRLMIAGSGEEGLMRKCNELDGAGKIIYEGAIDTSAVSGFLKKSKISINLSKFESFGYSIAESLLNSHFLIINKNLWWADCSEIVGMKSISPRCKISLSDSLDCIASLTDEDLAELGVFNRQFAQKNMSFESLKDIYLECF